MTVDEAWRHCVRAEYTKERASAADIWNDLKAHAKEVYRERHFGKLYFDDGALHFCGDTVSVSAKP